MLIDRHRYQPHVDGLRALAVVAVVLYHLGVPGFGGGFVGVDVFLVISGFLITRLIRREVVETGGFRFGRFYMRRIRRLAPAFLVMLAATMVASAFILSPAMLRELGREAVWSLLSVSNVCFWLEADYFDVAAKLKPLLHTWSLGVEEQFYLVWPALLAVVAVPRRQRPFVVSLAVVGIASLALNYPFGNGVGAGQGVLSSAFENGKPTIFFLLPFRIFEFVIGASLVLVDNRETRSRWINDALMATGLALIAYSVARFEGGMLYPRHYALVPGIGAALLIVAGSGSRLSMLLVNPVSIRVGLWSYSLYLVHWPLIVLFEYVKGPLLPLEMLLIGGCSIVLAALSHRFVEQPFRERRIRLRWLCPLGAAVFAAALHMWATQGWNWRVDQRYPVEVAGGAAEFHRQCYGGAGYLPGPVGTSAPPDIVLVGDSYGLHYAEGLSKEIAEPGHLALYIAAGTSCLNLPGFTRTTTDSDWDSVCPEAVKRVRDIVDAAQRPPIVIVSHAWLYQLGQAALLDADGKRIGADPVFEDIVAGIGRLRAELHGSIIVVIGQVPTMHGLNVYEELTRPAFARSRSIEEIVAPKPIDPKYRAFNSRMLEESERTGAFVFLDPCDALCRDGLCDGVDEDMQPLYSDGGHLSKVGSRRVVRALASRINEVIDSRSGTNSAR